MQALPLNPVLRPHNNGVHAHNHGLPSFAMAANGNGNGHSFAGSFGGTNSMASDQTSPLTSSGSGSGFTSVIGSGRLDALNVGGVTNTANSNGSGIGRGNSPSTMTSTNSNSLGGSTSPSSGSGVSTPNTATSLIPGGTMPSSVTAGATGTGQKQTLTIVTTTTSGNTSDPVYASVSHLLTRAYALPCSTAAQAFAQLVQPTARFQLALDALLPVLESSWNVESAQRILVSFILYSLYAPHPLAINPFLSVLYSTYVKEREKAVLVTKEGGVCPNEQLVWVLYSILQGDGNDIGPYSPSTLARTPLPPKLRAVNLVLDDELYNNTTNIDNVAYSYFLKQQNKMYGQQANSGHNSNHNTNGHNTPNLGNLTPGSAVQSPSFISNEEDRRNERLVQAMRLLLAARDRALTLSEQRVLAPLINEITASRIITSLDFTPIVARNSIIAHPLFVGLLNNASEDNNNVAHFLDILPYLPPTLTTMDLMGRLLRDQTYIKIPGYSTVADLVRMEILGRFIHESINWVERAEREEKEGLNSDDRFAKSVQIICRFFTSLIKLQIVDPSSDADSAEMRHFSLCYSRFEDANALYRVLALSRY